MRVLNLFGVIVIWILWLGIVVKPGKPVIHSKEKGGKLRVSQATIGFGEGSEKSVVVCKVGHREGVFVCSLVPDKIEFCHLELEFEEKDDLVFSVIGPRNVHLSGYYIELPFPSISDSYPFLLNLALICSISIWI